jgi:hypothetical protein
LTAFKEILKEQRWDDHRYYHHNLVNQSLHLVSAISFVVAYALLFWAPWLAALIGWSISMTSRQIGHFFFEPKGYDEVNQATHAYKEEIKVGYNLRRKIILHAIWAGATLTFYLEPSLFGLCKPYVGATEFFQRIGQIWLCIGGLGLVFRSVQLFYTRDLMTGLAWAAKILTDPFHDIKLYHRAPLCLFNHEMMDPVAADSHG